MERREVAFLNKHDIDRMVAALLGVSQDTVARFTEEFLKQAMNALIDVGAIRLSGFGTMKLTRRKGKMQTPAKLTRVCNGKVSGEALYLVDNKYYVSFTKGRALSDAIRKKKGRAKVVEERSDTERSKGGHRGEIRR